MCKETGTFSTTVRAQSGGKGRPDDEYPNRKAGAISFVLDWERRWRSRRVMIRCWLGWKSNALSTMPTPRRGPTSFPTSPREWSPGIRPRNRKPARTRGVRTNWHHLRGVGRGQHVRRGGRGGRQDVHYAGIEEKGWEGGL